MCPPSSEDHSLAAEIELCITANHSRPCPLWVKSVVLGALLDVRFTPKSGHQSDEIDVRLVPLATKVQRSTMTAIQFPLSLDVRSWRRAHYEPPLDAGCP